MTHIFNQTWQDQIAQNYLDAAVQAAEYAIAGALKPVFSIDGNMWCCSYGDAPNAVQGFGSTPYLALRDFNSEWHRKIEAK